MQIRGHRKIGIKPGFGLRIDRYGRAGMVFSLRCGWSLVTLTVARNGKQ
jgi:hypothetical protein